MKMMQKLLYSEEAEKAVLGSMLAQPHEVIGEIALKTEDFFVGAHREVFDCMCNLFETKQAVDAMSVHQWLTDRKLAEAVGSPGILADLLSSFATHLNVQAYAKSVKEKSVLRRLMDICSTIARDIQDRPDDVQGVLGNAESLICGVSNAVTTGSLLTASQCVDEYEEWREKIQRGEIESRLKTGLSALDATNGGLPVPAYVVVAGEQGVGKSALILNIMKNACLAGMPVGGFTMEMTSKQVTTRLVADIGDINSRRLNGKLHPGEEVAEAAAKERIRQWPFYLEPRSGLMPHDIRIMTRQMVRKGCKIIWLDNAQLMQGSSNREKRVEQLTEVSRTIQHLQREHNIIFILLAQITRDAQKRGNIKAFDLADCAAFERDARVVIMLERKAESENVPTYAVPVIARVVKYSEGETGDFEMVFNKQKQRFHENLPAIQSHEHQT
jgi:replicative DNA helicase